MKKHLAQIENPLITDPRYSAGADPEGVFFTGDLVSAIIRILFMIAVIFFMFQFLMGGIQWILSEGDKAKLEKARSQVQYSIIGLVVVFSLSVILYLLGRFFGIQGLENFTLQFPRI